MKKIFNILKKSTVEILLVLILLIVQANCDLALPDYTSKIVNIGIQQSGIESSVTNVISESELNKLFIFMNPEDKELVLDNYRKLDKDELSSKEYKKYSKKYKLLDEENLYILKSKDNYDDLKEIFDKSMMIVYSLSQDTEEINMMKTNMIKSMNLNIDVKDFDMFDYFMNMDSETINSMFGEMINGLNEMPEAMINQIAVSYVKEEYQHIGINTDYIQINYIIGKGIYMIGLAFVIMVIMILVAYLSSRIAAKFSRDLRSKVVNKVMAYSNKEFDELGSASLITRSTNDIQQIQMLIIMVLRILFYAPILGLGALNKVSGTSMSWVIGLAILIIITLVVVLFSIALPKFQIVQKLIDKLNLVSREILTGLPVIRAFSTEKYEKNRFDNANKDLTKTNLFVGRVMSLMMPCMMFIMNGVSILIIWVGSKKIDLGTMQVGDLMAFITYTMQIIMSFLMISMISIMLPRAWVSVKRIAEVLNKKLSIKDKDITKEFDESKKGLVEFKDVYFRYPDAEEDILTNISFKAEKGTTTAFIGSTGSGKSTLINLIPRFFDVTGGKILIDGVDIRDVKLHDLRNKIGYVPQKGMLFSGTIKSNILFGNSAASEEEMINASKISQSEEFIAKTKDKYDNYISQGGTNVSGGQRQRLAIARAIASNPEIYIFDDSFSALDYKTDYKLRKELSKVTKDSIIFIVAQRISTVLHADQIVVLDQGEIVGIGKHEELLKNCEVYQEIAYTQLSKEELEHE